MRAIYEPKGKAREYAALACNLYTGCPHGCRYCYGPTLPNPAKKGLTMQQWRAQWHSKTVARDGIHGALVRDCRRMYHNGDTRPVLLCFACDPYPPDEPEYKDGNWPNQGMTRQALHIMAGHGATPIILTKGGTRACRDFDILKAAGGWFGQTCSWGNDYEQAETWEPNAASIFVRFAARQLAAEKGIKTWWSVEPVLDTDQAFKFIHGPGRLADHLKLGKLSGYDPWTRIVEKSIDWPRYREEARAILGAYGFREIHTPGAFEVGTFYVKRELEEAT